VRNFCASFLALPLSRSTIDLGLPLHTHLRAGCRASGIFEGGNISESRTRTKYVYDGADIIEQKPSSGSTLHYVQGPGIDRHWASQDASGVVTYYLSDHLGSIVQATNAAATVTLSRDYDPFGNPLAGGATAGYTFTGREWDPETSLYYYRARYYDPNIGRFVSEDPIGSRDGLNRYTYVHGNPVNAIDPRGLSTTGFPPSSPSLPPPPPSLCYRLPPEPPIKTCVGGQCLLIPQINEPEDLSLPCTLIVVSTSCAMKTRKVPCDQAEGIPVCQDDSLINFFKTPQFLSVCPSCA
jgi:RHS repeat-associated protein